VPLPEDEAKWFVTPTELADWMKASQLAEDKHLIEALGSALEWTTDQVGPLEHAACTYSVWPSGRSLVLPDTHLESVTSVTDPRGTVIDVPPERVNLLAGVIEVSANAPLRRGTWTVVATTREHGHNVRLAVKIIASHLYEPRRGRAATQVTAAAMGQATPVGDGTPSPGFAIPRRATELLRPVQRPRGF